MISISNNVLIPSYMLKSGYLSFSISQKLTIMVDAQGSDTAVSSYFKNRISSNASNLRKSNKYISLVLNKELNYISPLNVKLIVSCETIYAVKLDRFVLFQ
jgi:hypothetical protein